MRIELTLSAAEQALLTRLTVAAEAQAASLATIATVLQTNLPLIAEYLKPEPVVGIGINLGTPTTHN